MIVQVLLKERINEFDFRTWDVSVACGRGMQPIRWLGHVACARMAYETGDVPAKYIPQAVRALGKNTVLHPCEKISEVLQDGAQVEVECSRGPESFTVNWDGKPPPAGRDFFPKKGTPEPAAAPAPPENENVTTAIDWTKYDFSASLNRNYTIWEKECGIIQCLLLWYCSQGDEIEDKDFGLINFCQYRQLFHDCKLCTDATVEEHLKTSFEEGLKVKNVPGGYQLSALEFIPAIVRLVSYPFYAEKVPERDRNQLSTMVTHLIRTFLIPCLKDQISGELQKIHEAARTGTVCTDVLNENGGLFGDCLKICSPNRVPRVKFSRLLPYLRKWLVLGDHWLPRRASLLIIYAYQESADVAEFKPMPLSFTLGPEQLRRFLFGASYYAFMASTSLIRISDHAYLRDFLEKVFKRAGVAKPLYTTYEEKKAYLRGLLIRE